MKKSTCKRSLSFTMIYVLPYVYKNQTEFLVLASLIKIYERKMDIRLHTFLIVTFGYSYA